MSNTAVNKNIVRNFNCKTKYNYHSRQNNILPFEFDGREEKKSSDITPDYVFESFAFSFT